MGMTALVAPVCDIPITSYVIEGDGQITLFGNINSSELDAGFTFKSWACSRRSKRRSVAKAERRAGRIFRRLHKHLQRRRILWCRRLPRGRRLMYSYCNSYDTSDYIPGSGETTDVTNTVQVTIKIDEAENVVINILAGEQFAVVNIGPPSVGAGPWSYTQANVAYLKRLQAGAAMVITEDSDKIVIAAKQLTADLDLYVANGNPDISPDFSTVQNALNYLGQYLIPTTIRARIHVQRGVYVLPPDPNYISITHPNAQNITIQGPQNPTLQATSISAITGSVGNWSVTFAGLGSTSGILVNDWVIVNNPNGPVKTTLPLVLGFFKVTAVTASTITARVTWRGSSFAIPTFTSVNITPITAIISPPINTYGIAAWAAGIGLIRYLGVVAQQTPTINVSGIVTSGAAEFSMWELPATTQPLMQPRTGWLSALSPLRRWARLFAPIAP